MKTRLRDRSDEAKKLVDQRPAERAWGCLLGIGSLTAMCVGVLAESAVVVGCGAMMAGLLALSRLMADARSGVTSSNWGTWRRDDNSASYYCNVYFWAVIAVLWFVAGLATLLGYLSVWSAWLAPD